MKKVTTLVLMLGFILSGALCYANGAARTENEIGGVKSTITIGSPSGIIVPSNSNKCFRASESITITSEGEFTLPLGAQMTLMTHDCVDY